MNGFAFRLVLSQAKCNLQLEMAHWMNVEDVAE